MSRIRIEPVTDSNPGTLPSELGFGRHFTRRMFTQRYTPEAGWHDAVIGPYRALSIDPAASVFQCGQNVFEGTKAYRRPDGDVNLFRVEENARRFNLSAQRMGMPQLDADAHIEAISELVRLEHEWIPAQEGAALYVRPVMVATDPVLEVRASRGYLHYIILSPVGPYFGAGLRSVGVYLADEHVRAVRGGTGAAKTSVNYAGSLATSESAKARGYQQVLWLDAIERRYIEEAGAMNIAFVYGGREIVTPALSGSILAGVTRASVLRLAPDLGYAVRELRLDVAEVLAAIERGDVTEVFSMGTGAVIAPVGRLGLGARDYRVGDGEVGPVARTLYQALTGIQFGRAADRYGWTRVIKVR